MAEYIYLLQEREFIKTKENIYKIGMTRKENHTRFNQYPKGSILLFQMICPNSKKIETELIKLFKIKFKLRTDIGHEYFEGCYYEMIDYIYTTIYTTIRKHTNYIIPAQIDTYTSSDEENITNLPDENIILPDEQKESDKYLNMEYNQVYSDYLLRIEPSDKYIIFNAETLTLVPFDTTTMNILKYTIGKVNIELNTESNTEPNTQLKIDISLIDTSIINNIINSLIITPAITEYKKLIKNILVANTDREIIFYDYYDYGNDLLSMWLIDLLYVLSGSNYYCYSSDYYEKKLILKNHKYRFVILNYDVSKVSIKSQIKDFQQLGFTIMIVKQRDTKKTYNTKINYKPFNLKNHLLPNINNIIKCVKNQSPNSQVVDTEYINIYTIFKDPNLLLFNFLKWCCSV